MNFINKVLQWLKEPGNLGKAVFLIAVFLIIFGIYGNITHTNKIRKSHLVLCGTVLDMISHKGGVDIRYYYYYGGKRYEYHEGAPEKTYKDYIERRINSLLIVIEKGNPSNDAILSKDEDYEKYAIKPEDTLNVKCP